MPFGLTLSRHGGSSVVALSGELDMENAPEVKECFDRLVEQGHIAIVVDLTGLTFCDSAGISALVHGFNRCRTADGRLRITGESGPVAGVLDLTGVRTFLRHSGPDDSRQFEDVTPPRPSPPIVRDRRQPGRGTRHPLGRSPARDRPARERPV
jgi:anti-sigma B factor antagonist